MSKYKRQTDPNLWPWVAQDELLPIKTVALLVGVSRDHIRMQVNLGVFPPPVAQYVGPRSRYSPYYWRLADFLDFIPASEAEFKAEQAYAGYLGVAVGVDAKGRRVYGGDSAFAGGTGYLRQRKTAKLPPKSLGWKQVRAKPSIEAIACFDGECYPADSHPGLRASI